MIDQAVSEFGKLDILVNNAGILRDRMLVNMSEAEWDAVIAVHLKGTFNMTRHANAYFRGLVKADPKLKFPGRIINTASDAGLLGNMGQTNYGAAKAGIAAFTVIAALENKRGKYCTVNCVVPIARTRLTTDATPKFADTMSKLDEKGLDVFDPANFAPMIVFLASDAGTRISGEVFRISGDKCWVYQGWHAFNMIENDGKPFTPEILADRVKKDLMKGLPRREGLIDAISQMIKM
jgi:NAD(P)-dependent dehydrogenase (short-subunit alcohol dehydrogenase family)